MATLTWREQLELAEMLRTMEREIAVAEPMVAAGKWADAVEQRDRATRYALVERRKRLRWRARYRKLSARLVWWVTVAVALGAALVLAGLQLLTLTS